MFSVVLVCLLIMCYVRTYGELSLYLLCVYCVCVVCVYVSFVCVYVCVFYLSFSLLTAHTFDLNFRFQPNQTLIPTLKAVKCGNDGKRSMVAARDIKKGEIALRVSLSHCIHSANPPTTFDIPSDFITKDQQAVRIRDV